MVLSKLKFSDYILVSILFGVLTTFFTYSYGNGDQIEQLPIIYRFIDPNYLTNDFFVNSNAGYSPRYFYANLIAFLSKSINIPALFFIGTLLSNIGISSITFLTANKLFDNKNSGIVAAALVMVIPVINLGSAYYLYQTQFNPTTFAFPLVLWAFYNLIQRRFICTLCITGIISIFHVLIGFEYGIVFLSISLLLDIFNKESFKKILQKGGIGVSIILLFLLPNLIPYFNSNGEISSTTFIEIVANFRHPHHYLLSDILTLKETAKFIIISFVFILLFSFWKKNTNAKFYTKIIGLLSCILIILSFFNWMFTEVIPSKLITTLQFLRLLDILKWIVILLAANHLVNWFQNRVNLQRLKLIVFSLLLLFVSSKYLVNQLRSQPEKNYFSFSQLEKSKKGVSNFIQENTDKNSVFLTPHDFGFIRVHSKRALVVDFKAFPFQNMAMQEWYKRIEACYGLDESQFEKNYSQLTDKKIAVLEKTYHFTHVILTIETQTKFPIMYQNEDFKIIDLSSYDQ